MSYWEKCKQVSKKPLEYWLTSKRLFTQNQAKKAIDKIDTSSLSKIRHYNHVAKSTREKENALVIPLFQIEKGHCGIERINLEKQVGLHKKCESEAGFDFE